MLSLDHSVKFFGLKFNFIYEGENIVWRYRNNSTSGMVFDDDWFATPFVLMTCQVCYLEIKQGQKVVHKNVSQGCI